MIDHALAFWTVAPGRGEIRRETLPPPGAGDVVVRTLYSGVSRGTEALVFHGRVPVEEYQRMRAPFQAGDFPAPVKYGYASVGVVEHGPHDLAGRRVFALHPHQTRYVLPATAVHPMPDGVPSRRAVLAANLETAINAVVGRRAWPRQPRRGGRRAARSAASSPGWPGACPAARSSSSTCASRGRPWRRGSASASRCRRAAVVDCDVVFHASATADGLATAVRLAGVEATVVELSWYGAGVGAGPARRRLPFAAAGAEGLAGRSGGAGAASALDPRPAAAAGAVAARRSRARRPDRRRLRASTPCPR